MLIYIWRCFNFVLRYQRSTWYYSVFVREKPLGRTRDVEVSDPRAGCAGPTRGSAENNAWALLARPASDPFLAGHDLNRPVIFFLTTT